MLPPFLCGAIAPFPRSASLALAILISALCGLAPSAGAETPGPEVPGSLVLHKWSGTLNVPDPVACTVDPQGRVYVASTSRRRVGDLEIREYPTWVANELALTSVEEKAAFLKQALPPGNPLPPRGSSIIDQNADGSVDWKDLTVPSERIFQLRDTDGDGTADKITVFAEGFNTLVTGVAAGVLYHDGWVYVTVSPDLWRFKDTNDDGVADIREQVVHGFGMHIGYGGHDMHGLVLGTDGRIYWSIGDKGVNVTSREGRRFFYPNEGAVMRVEPDGSGFEVYAHGLRNLQEPAFNEYGDLIGVDNDADMAGEKERFVTIPEASDNGWRINYQFMGLRSPWMTDGLWKPRFPEQPLYFIPPIENYPDAPAGFKRDPGTALNDAFRGIYLLNAFPSGKMWGFRVEPDGASFKMVDRAVRNEGVMGVGMSWHPDGSLMMVDWIGGWVVKGTGAIWRVDTQDGEQNPLRIETQQIIAKGFSDMGESALLPLLGHPDQRVRLGAQMELAKRGQSAALLRMAQDESAVLFARLHAIWGYGQLLRRNAADVAPALALLRDADPEIRTQTARIVGDAASAGSRAGALIPLLADEFPRVRFQAAIALGKLREPSAVEPLLAMAAKDFEESVLRHAVVTGLAGCASEQQLAANSSAPSAAVRIASVLALRRQASAAIAAFLHDSDPRVVDEAARGIYDDLSIPDALPTLASLLDGTQRREATTRRIINANLRLGTAESAARLLSFALDSSSDREMREEALSCLQAWPAPGTIDRVDGYSRSIQTARIDTVLTPHLDALLSLDDVRMKTLGIEIMNAHSLKASAAQIASIVRDAQAPGELRAQALRLLGGEQRESPLFGPALEAGLSLAAPAPLLAAAMELLLPADPKRLVTQAQTVLRTRGIPEQQHALGLLAQAASAEADAVILDYAGLLLAGTCPPEVQLDVIEALRTRSAANAKLKEQLDTYVAAQQPPLHGELLAGGSSERGSEIVHNNLAANCLSCHSIDDRGGSEIGPNLRVVGSHRDPAQLLESLITPSAQIAPGFGVVSVTLKDGSNVAGTLAQESAESITVRLFDGSRRTVSRGDIAEQTPPISVMPPMLGILQPREIRDAVAYLTSLKSGRN